MLPRLGTYFKGEWLVHSTKELLQEAGLVIIIEDELDIY